MSCDDDDGALPLRGLRVLDMATLFAGPVMATLLGDYGADVIKVEHPRGDSLRGLGWSKDGHSLWWMLCARNKRPVTLDLSQPRGAALARELAARADVLIENFRPGTMERWGLGWEELHAINPRLVMVRTTGFGQTGPYRSRAGFGTLAESMSGYAHINGFPGGPPTLPPFALGDGIAALTGVSALMIAIYERDVLGSGKGQWIDLSIYEPLFWILGPQALVYDQLGIVQHRTGNRAPFTAPRNAYLAADGVWLGLSASSQSVAERVMHIVGRPELIEESWFSSHAGRLEHVDLLDAVIGEWIAERTSTEVVEVFGSEGAAIAPIYTIADCFEDPQFIERDTITTVEHPELGPVRMQNVVPRLSRTPGSIRRVGGELGECNEEIYVDELGHDLDELEGWRTEGII
ncbi:MAG: CoA transferase [Euzebyales bacterium]|nr:CoA transferase [Euzebyales bacterium]